jgi:hypothetical protein
VTGEEERVEFLAGETQASRSLGFEEVEDVKVYLG